MKPQRMVILCILLLIVAIFTGTAPAADKATCYNCPPEWADWASHANDFQRMVGTTKDLHDGVQAVIDFVNQPGDDMDWSNTLLIVTADHSNSYTRNKVKLSAGDLPEQKGIGSCGYGGAACTYPKGEVTYGSTAHTNELVRLYAFGAGIMKFHKYEGDWYPGTRILDNTQLFHVMMEAAGSPMPSPLSLK